MWLHKTGALFSKVWHDMMPTSLLLHDNNPYKLQRRVHGRNMFKSVCKLGTQNVGDEQSTIGRDRHGATARLSIGGGSIDRSKGAGTRWSNTNHSCIRC